MEGCKELRLVLLGKTGCGKSSSANTILGGGKWFRSENSSISLTQKCVSQTAQSNGRKITVVDTPGFYDTDLPEKELRSEMMKCISECAPGPHAFVIMMKVETLTRQELTIMKKIEASFGEEAFKYAVVLFTHGDQLDDNLTIDQFVKMTEALRRFVERCGNRCHVIDNKYWNHNEQDEYRRNSVQVEALMKTIEQMVEQNGGGCYTNELLQAVDAAKQAEKKRRLERKGKASEAKNQTWSKLLKGFAVVAVGVFIAGLWRYWFQHHGPRKVLL